MNSWPDPFTSKLTPQRFEGADVTADSLMTQLARSAIRIVGSRLRGGFGFGFQFQTIRLANVLGLFRRELGVSLFGFFLEQLLQLFLTIHGRFNRGGEGGES